MTSQTKMTVTTLRLPSELWVWLKQRAAGNYRTLNNEMLALLEEERKREAANASSTNA